MKTKTLFSCAGIFLAAFLNGFGQPVVTTEPQSRTNVLGTDATFTVVAIDSCAQEPRVKAGLSPEGGTHMGTPAFDRPFLILGGGDNDSFMQYFRDASRDLDNRLAHDAYWVHLTNSTHCDFNDRPWFDSPTSTALIRRALVQDRYGVSFFRKYLRSEDDHFLDTAPAIWPEVDQFLNK